MSNGLWKWRQRYERALLPTIPIAKGSKRPIVLAWQHTPPGEQWRQVGGDRFRGNLAILMGDGTAVIDCDAPQTLDAVSSKLVDLGLEPPYVNTPSGGRHYYIRIADAPQDFTWTTLAVGPGELRVRNAAVVAPCSTYDTRRYKWALGTAPEDVPKQRAIKWRDLSWLLRPAEGTGELTEPLTAPPVRLLWRPAPPQVDELLDALRTAPRGAPVAKIKRGQLVGQYASRSEAEAAVVAMLILSGWSFSEIRDVFEQARPGHYADYEKPSHRRHYLERTYHNVLNHLASTPERQQIASWYRLAEMGDWPGRGGTLDRAVYLAAAAIGWQWSTATPAAAQRDLAQLAAASRQGVHNALRRLAAAGLLEPINTQQAAHHARSYALRAYMPEPFTGQTASPYTALSVTYGKRMTHPPNVELWGQKALGRTAGAVYAHLSAREALTISELARRTGKARKTVRRALARLAAHELATPEGTADNGTGAEGWKLGPADVASVAAAFETDVKAERRRWQHTLEREAWQEALGRKAVTAQTPSRKSSGGENNHG